MNSAAAIENFLEMMSAERGAAENTLASYAHDLEAVAEFMTARGIRLPDAGTSDIRAYLDEMAGQGFAATSQARRLSALRQFFRFLFTEGFRKDDPIGILDAPKKERPLPKIMSEDAVGRLLDRAKLEVEDPTATPGADNLRAARLHALIETLYATGMRVSELVGLPSPSPAPIIGFCWCAAKAPRSAWCRCR